MYVESEIYISSSSKKSLPENALVEIDNKFYALVLQNSNDSNFTFIKKEIKLGSINNGKIEILNFQEFNANAQFLIKGAFNLIND